MHHRSPVLLLVAFLVLLALVALAWIYFARPGGTSASPSATSTPATATSGPAHIEENADYYAIDATYPRTTPLAASAGSVADISAVASMRVFEENAVASFKQDGNFANLTASDAAEQGLGPNRKYSLDISYDSFSSAHAVSYVYLVEEDTLGAHPNGTWRTFTFDSATGKPLLLSDLFTPGASYLSTLSTIARKQLPAIIAKAEGVTTAEVDTGMLNDGTTPNDDNFENFYLDGSRLVILFTPYQVGPYAAGPQTLPIPLSSLGTIVSAQYR